MYEGKWLAVRQLRNNVRLAAIRKQIVPEWPPIACKNSMRLAAGRIQIVPEWPPVPCKNSMRPVAFIYIVPEWLPVACKLCPCGRQSQANYRRFYSCCMRLVARRVQFACDWRLLGNNLNATGHQSHAIFACASGHYSAKPLVFWKHAVRTIIWIKKWGNH
jgi:hypothetical protein